VDAELLAQLQRISKLRTDEIAAMEENVKLKVAVQPIAAVEPVSFVIHVERPLPLERNLSQRKLVRQTLFVSGFQ